MHLNVCVVYAYTTVMATVHKGLCVCVCATSNRHGNLKAVSASITEKGHLKLLAADKRIQRVIILQLEQHREIRSCLLVLC